ncbi:hypothetical protein YA62_020795 [Agrobacterium sp. LC34]|uniref:hypothetical protein n=1 Tax=Agrobacterium sp. LC34 TaxID=1643810 RepID=UPI000AEBC1E9|nr:hypothetical protein [Agrobacterium sp. LC34]TKT57429.1 hypothetical protein YA62_020795 [Agrobacterium sp. LC34]
MRSPVTNFARAACWITLFSAAGFGLMKLAFAFVCWVGGHNLLEASVGAVASVALGVGIGIESFLWLRDWRMRKLDDEPPSRL